MSKVRLEAGNWIPRITTDDSSLVLGHSRKSCPNESQPEATADQGSSDLGLMRKVGRGNREAQEQMVHRLLPGIRRVAKMLSRCTVDADDATQLVMLELLRSAKGYRGEARVESWARRIAVRTIIRHCKRERQKWEKIANHSSGTKSYEVAEFVSTESERTHEMGDELPRHVLDYLSELSEVQRQAIVLHHVFGYSLGEIAELEKVSSNTIKGRMRLGLATLRRLIRQERTIGGRK